jgi:hypothetical protein
VWLEIKHIETLSGNMDWEGESREVKYSLTFVRGIGLSSLTHGLRSLRKIVHLNITRRLKLTPDGLHTCEALIQKQYEGCADTACSRY